MIAIGGVWLIVIIACFEAPAPCQPQSFQRGYSTMAQCQKAKAAILRRYPRAYVACDR